MTPSESVLSKNNFKVKGLPSKVTISSSTVCTSTVSVCTSTCAWSKYSFGFHYFNKSNCMYPYYLYVRICAQANCWFSRKRRWLGKPLCPHIWQQVDMCMFWYICTFLFLTNSRLILICTLEAISDYFRALQKYVQFTVQYLLVFIFYYKYLNLLLLFKFRSILQVLVWVLPQSTVHYE